MSAATLDDASVEAVAQRVAELLRDESVGVGQKPTPTPPDDLVDVADVARRFSVSRDWVYANAERIGAIRLGDGPRARLRFDPAVVAEALNVPRPSEDTAQSTRRRRRKANPETVDLLPIRGGSR